METLCVVSVSGGKDSTATLLLALDTMPNVQAVFADTGNEHSITYEYLEYLEDALKIRIDRVKADFSKQIERHRQHILQKWPEEGVSPDKVKRAANASNPTGNPYLDMVIWKGRFPSEAAGFCTEELKIKPITEYIMKKIDEGWRIESWQGVRAQESPKRAGYPERERVDEFIEIVRPIHKWSWEQVFAFHDLHGIKPNPLYKMGMGRVGCMPCIRSRKKEIDEISLRFPEEIERIESWEKIMMDVSKRDCSTFFPSDGVTNEEAYENGNIRKVVEWARGKKPSLFLDHWERMREARKISCSSEYGLCE